MISKRLQLLTADWVLPVTGEPVSGGSVVVGPESIRFVGPSGEAGERFPEAKRIAYPGKVLLPGLVNAHCHLDNGFLKDRIRLRRDQGFFDWVRRGIDLRESVSAEDKRREAAAGLSRIEETGTVAVGDITHDPYTLALFGRTRVEAVCFHEVTGFATAEADGIYEEKRLLLEKIRRSSPFRHFICPHSPYSVSRALLERIAGDRSRVSFHLAESADEVEFLRKGHPGMEAILKSLGKWDPEWRPPGVSPVRYFDEIGLLHPEALAVHMVRVEEEDYPVLEKTRPHICLCPGSNAHLHNGLPPVRDYLQMGLNLCLGTDGLGSNADLSLVREMRLVKKRFPDLDDGKIVEMGTLGGARALGLEEKFGSLEPGKTARIAVLGRGSGKGPYSFLQEKTGIGAFPEPRYLIPVNGYPGSKKADDTLPCDVRF